MAEYNTVEGIYEAIDKCDGDKDLKSLAGFWKESLGISRSPMKALVEYRDMAFLSKDLAQIRRDYRIPEDLEQFRIHLNREEALKQFENYGFKSLMDKL